jgi:hypothetical protein
MVSSINFKWLAVLGCLCVAGLSNADIIYNNFGLGSPSGWVVTYGATVENGYPWDTGFNTGSTAWLLSSITVDVGWYGGTNNVIVDLIADNNGSPGTVMDSWELYNLPNFSELTPQTSINVSSIGLAANTQYWVGVSAGAPDTLEAWSATDPAVDGPMALNGSSYQGQQMDLRLDGTAVPEPFTWVSLASGLGLLFARRRRTAKA